jgi:hypothetical protein
MKIFIMKKIVSLIIFILLFLTTVLNAETNQNLKEKEITDISNNSISNADNNYGNTNQKKKSIFHSIDKDTEKVIVISSMVVIHETINIYFGNLAYEEKTAVPYYGLAGFYGVVGTALSGNLKLSLIVSSCYLAQGLYNDFYLLKKNTHASRTRVIAENFVFYHLPLLPLLLWDKFSEKPENNISFNLNYYENNYLLSASIRF